MKFTRIYAAYFSPTGGTKRIVQKVAGQIGHYLELPVEEIDITLPDGRTETLHFGEKDLLVIGIPVYAGRVPNKLLPDLEKMFVGKQTALIPVSVYGNRNFDDALMELKLVLENNGFQTAAAAAVVSRHAFSDKIGAGRPDVKDIEEIQEFAQKAAEKLADASNLQPVNVSGNNPVGPYYTPLGLDEKPAKFLKAKPITDVNSCSQCGKCAEVCPMGSIDKKDHTVVSGICIKCQACIRVCPEHAKSFTDENFWSHVKMLETTYVRRGKNQFFV